MTPSSIAEIEDNGDDNNGGFFDPSLGFIDYTYGLSQKTIVFTAQPFDNQSIKLTNHTVSDSDIGNCAHIGGGWYSIVNINAKDNTWIFSDAINETTSNGICGGPLRSLTKAIELTNKYNVKLKAFVKGYDVTGYETHRLHRMGLGPTAAQIATAIWSDSLLGGDFDTAGSIGLLLSSLIDAAISSRLAATAVPSNFSFLNIDAATGGIALQPSGLDNITAWGGVTARRAIFYAAASCLGKISGLPSGPAIVKGLDGISTVATITLDTNGNRTGVTLNSF
jgi:hypothetical protein